MSKNRILMVHEGHSLQEVIALTHQAVQVLIQENQSLVSKILVLDLSLTAKGAWSCLDVTELRDQCAALPDALQARVLTLQPSIAEGLRACLGSIEWQATDYLEIVETPTAIEGLKLVHDRLQMGAELVDLRILRQGPATIHAWLKSSKKVTGPVLHLEADKAQWLLAGI